MATDPPAPRTDFVRRLLAERPLGPDDYAEDLIQLERTIAAGGPLGIASGMAFLHLLSRYPREYEAIRSELGAEALDEPRERIELLLEERIRLAASRSGTPNAIL